MRRISTGRDFSRPSPDRVIRDQRSHDAVSPAIRELVALGFVEITEKGCAGNENQRRAARYRLTYVNNVGRSQPTHDWKEIKTMEAATGLAATARAAKDPRAAAAGRRGKNKIPVPETRTGTGPGNQDRNTKSPVLETRTTSLVPETRTTIYILPPGGRPQPTINRHPDTADTRLIWAAPQYRDLDPLTQS